MSTGTNKMDSSEVYSMFESIKELIIKKEKQPEKLVEATEPLKIEIDTSVINAATERFVKATEEANKPSIVEHRHRHKIDIDIQSNWFFFSWIALFFIIGALFWILADQRETINKYKENDLKYRYVKMIGQTNEDSFIRLEHQFQYSDSIKIIHKQVEKYEELVKERAEKLERMKQNGNEVESIQKDLKTLNKTK